MSRVGLFSLEDPRDGLSVQVLYCLRAIGATVHVFTDDRWLPIAQSRFCRSYNSLPVPLGVRPNARFLNALEAACREKSIDILVPCDIRATLMLAAARHRLRRVRVFPSSAPELIAYLNDKWSFCQLLRELNLPHPPTYFLDRREDIHKIVGELGFPLICKPRNLSGGRGVQRVDCLEDLEKHLDGGEFGELPLLMQRFVPGLDGGISLLADRGRLLANATQRKEPDGTIEFLRDAQAEAIAQQVVAAVGYTGVAHIDLRFSSGAGGGVQAIECNPRLWYSCPAAAWQGLNFVDLGLRQAAGSDGAADHEPLLGSVQPLSVMLSRIRQAPSDIGRLSKGTWLAAYYALSDPRPIVVSRRSR